MAPKSNDMVVLMNFLKSGMSTRELDKAMGHSSLKTKGWKSWEILKSYGLKNSDKGKLFLYSERQSRQIINILMKNSESSVDNLVKKNPPKTLEKYKNTYVLAESEKSFYNIFSGETRNTIQSFFNPMKKLISKCQFSGCKYSAKQLDTVHYMADRPEIFMKCAERFKKDHGKGLFRYDVYRVMTCFLRKHSKSKSICFLCKLHHNELHRSEKQSKKTLINFKKKIKF